jgi:F-type H+-transporting ATPase subunit epsilon
MDKIQLEVVTPQKVEFSRPVDMFVAPGIDGCLGVLPGHIPLVTRLEVGILQIYDNDDIIKLAVSEGYLEVTPSKAVILAEAAELPEEIDIQRVLESKRRAEERLATLEQRDINFFKAQASLQRALNRLKLVGEDQKNKDK